MQAVHVGEMAVNDRLHAGADFRQLAAAYHSDADIRHRRIADGLADAADQPAMGSLHRLQFVDEIGRDAKTGRVIVDVDPRYFRPAEVDELRGDASKARKILGWEPRVGFPELVELMMRADLERCRSERS